MTTYSGFLEKSLSSCAMQKSKKTYYYPHNESLVFRCLSMTDANCEYGFLFWYNESEEGVLEEKVVLEKSQNFNGLAPYDLIDFRVKVSPGKHKIIVFKRTDPLVKWKFNFKSRFSFGEKEYLEEIYEKGKKI